MKIPFIIAIMLGASVSNGLLADKPVPWPTKSLVIDTGWVNSDPSASCPETHYPISIEIMPLEGDGARYKAVFIPKPNGAFVFKAAVGLKTEEYQKLNEDLIAKEFVQISHQVVTVMIGNVHQAVWVSNAQNNEQKRENKPEMATPRKPSD